MTVSTRGEIRKTGELMTTPAEIIARYQKYPEDWFAPT